MPNLQETIRSSGQKAFTITKNDVEFGTGLFAESGGRTDVPWAYKDEETGELIFTSGQKPQPYMRPAIDNNREKIVRMIKEGFSID